MGLLSLFCPDKDFVAISAMPSGFSGKKKYCWSGHVSGVTKSYKGKSAQKIIATLSIGDELYLALPKESPQKIAVITSAYRQIGWYEGSHYEDILACLATKAPVYAILDKKGKIDDSTKNITWCSVRVTLFENPTVQVDADLEK